MLSVLLYFGDAEVGPLTTSRPYPRSVQTLKMDPERPLRGLELQAAL
jgi:hypothetical protein